MASLFLKSLTRQSPCSVLEVSKRLQSAPLKHQTGKRGSRRQLGPMADVSSFVARKQAARIVGLCVLLLVAPLSGADDNCSLDHNRKTLFSDPVCGSSPALTNCDNLTPSNQVYYWQTAGSSPTTTFGTSQGNNYNSLTACCKACQASSTCDAFNFRSASGLCYFIGSTECGASGSRNWQLDASPVSPRAADGHGNGGATAQQRCNPGGTLRVPFWLWAALHLLQLRRARPFVIFAEGAGQ